MSARRPACSLAALGVANALGRSPGEIRPRLLAGDPSRFTRRDDLIPGESRLFGVVPGELPELAPELARYDCRNNRLALLALDGIRAELERAISAHGAHRIGVVVGTSTSGIAEAERAFRARAAQGEIPPWFHLEQLEFGGLSGFLARAAGLRGPSYTLATACSAGAKALASARSLLELGLCDAVVAGGVDSLCRLTANGFHALQALAKDLTNPMSRYRDGITLGEGAALFLVTRDGGGVQLLGVGESSDAHHISAPDPDGRGAEACMRGALEDAGLAPSAIAYLNLHGTGTPQNDAVEAAAVFRVFGAGIPCSSTKPLFGHTLGASGALEAAVCWMLLRGRSAGSLELPPHRWDGREDPELPRLGLVGEAASAAIDGPAALLSNSFGFGGSNCALVIGDAR